MNCNVQQVSGGVLVVAPGTPAGGAPWIWGSRRLLLSNEAGAAIRCNNLPAAAWKIASLLDDSGRLGRMREAARKLADWKRQRDLLKAAYDGVLDEPVPPQLAATLRGGSGPSPVSPWLSSWQ